MAAHKWQPNASISLIHLNRMASSLSPLSKFHHSQRTGTWNFNFVLCSVSRTSQVSAIGNDSSLSEAIAQTSDALPSIYGLSNVRQNQNLKRHVSFVHVTAMISDIISFSAHCAVYHYHNIYSSCAEEETAPNPNLKARLHAVMPCVNE